MERFDFTKNAMVGSGGDYSEDNVTGYCHDLETTTISVRHNIELARGHGVRGIPDNGIALLRHTLYTLKGRSDSMIPLLYREIVVQLIRLMQQKQIAKDTPSLQRELSLEQQRLERIDRQLEKEMYVNETMRRIRRAPA